MMCLGELNINGYLPAPTLKCFLVFVKTMLLPCIYTKLVLCGLLRQCKSLAAQARSGRFRITPGYSYVRASAARWCI